MVRAKFFCSEKTEGPTGTVTLHPVTSGSPENERFFSLTPGGYISLSTVNEDAFLQFEKGKEYYIDFSPAD